MQNAHLVYVTIPFQRENPEKQNVVEEIQEFVYTEWRK